MAVVVFDTSFLVPLLDPRVKGVGQIDAKLTHLIETLDKQKDVVIVPTPALSETLIGAGDAAPNILKSSARHRASGLRRLVRVPRLKRPNVTGRPCAAMIKRKAPKAGRK